MNDVTIFSGTSNQPLAQKICDHLKIPLGNVYTHNFPSGESYIQYKQNIRGTDVFLVQGAGQGNANDHFMQLLVMADAARRASASRITAVLPMMSYSRQDRKTASRVPISAKLALDMIEAAGIDRVLTMDLHSPQVGGFTNLPFDQLAFEPLLIEQIRQKCHSPEIIRDTVVIMAPDVGAVKRAEKYASLLNCDFGFISKKRIGDEKVELQNFSGNVDGKLVYIIDDMTESCGTLIQAGKACKDNGAARVTCAVTHFCTTTVGMGRLNDNMKLPGFDPSFAYPIDEFIYSNTIDHKWSMDGINEFGVKPENLKMVDVSSLFARAIDSIHNNKSISELFN